MSDSEDSESFLSADEGEGGEANESSDITLSSDSEPEQGGKDATGGQDSSDITLSSDEDEGEKQPAKAAPSASDSAAPVTKNAKVNKTVDHEKESTDKSVPSHDNKPNTIEQPCSAGKAEGIKVPLNMSDISAALPSSDHVATQKQLFSQTSVATNQTPNANEPLQLKEELNETVHASRGPLSVPVQESTASQVQSSPNSSAPKPPSDSKEGTALSSAPPVALDPAEGEGWGDLGDVTVTSEAVSATVDREGEAADWGWSDDQVPAPAADDTSQSTPPAQTGEPPPPSEPVLPPRPQAAAAPEPSPPAAEPTKSTEPAESRPERKRPERKERRGPLKLGAKKLGAKVTPATAEPPEPAVKEGGATDDTVKEVAPPTPAASERKEDDEDGWGSWETWGSSLLTSAVDVTKVVLETVETGFGAPDPEDLARVTKEEQEQERQKRQQERQRTETVETPTPAAAAATDGAPPDGGAGLGLGSWFGGVSRVLGQTSSLVVNTGLDTLEAIGKKTMHVLQDDQLGIHDTLSQLGGRKPSLSQALREARERRGEAVPCPAGSGGSDAGLVHPPTFSHLFDQCDGTVHLEALEMLSSRCRSRVTAAAGRLDEAAGVLLEMIEDLCSPDELDEAEVADFEAELSTLVSRLSVPIKPTRLIIAQSSAAQWLESRPADEPPAPREALTRAVRTTAEVGAGLAEFLHKLAELQLVESVRDPVSAGRHLARLAALVAGRAGQLAAGFAETLSKQRNERAAAATTDIYLEVSYLQKFCGDSLRLMAPVLQMAVVKDKP